MKRWLPFMLGGVCLACAISPPLRAQEPPAAAAGTEARYHQFSEFEQAMRVWATRLPAAVRVERITHSTAGAPIFVVRIAAPGDTPPDERVGVLVVGGLNPAWPAGAETALGVTRGVLDALTADTHEGVAGLLRRYVVYIVPRANPEGDELFFASPKRVYHRNLRPVDDDRDGKTDEDGPNDLNSDGFITVMRVREPGAEWLPEPEEPRLMKRANRGKDERGVYRLLMEGVDDDGDGEINEDGAGGVDLDRNWPHFYEPGLPETGPHQLSEPETRALADFVVSHPNIAAAIVYGRHDNIVNVPTGDARGPLGIAYRDLHPDDIPLYKHVSEKYREITGLTKSTGCKPEGAFYAWLYAQRGIPTFATQVWWPEANPDDATATQPTSAPSDSDEDDDAKPAEPKLFDAPADDVAALVESSEMAKSLLALADEAGADHAFVEWTAVAHPDLGRVEIGGFIPFFATAPKPESLTGLAERELRFLEQVLEMLPRVRLEVGEISNAGGDVWQVELRLTNDGYFPTHCGSALHTDVPGWVVRPEVARERLLGTPTVARVENVPGSGGSVPLRWLVRGARGESVEFTAYSRTYGKLHATVTLREVRAGLEGE